MTKIDYWGSWQSFRLVRVFYCHRWDGGCHQVGSGTAVRSPEL